MMQYIKGEKTDFDAFIPVEVTAVTDDNIDEWLAK
jgi:hypothetical protein